MTSTKPFNQASALRIIGNVCKKYDISLEALRAAFPARPTNDDEFLAIAQWMQGVWEDKGQPALAPSSPQTVDYAGIAPLEDNGKAKAWRYAVREGADGLVKFYRVKRGRKAGVFFVDVQASDDLYPIKNPATRREILQAIAKDPKAALALYGQEIGSCGRCGRTLTSEYRQLGIGPVCIDK